MNFHQNHIKLTVAFAFISIVLLTGSAFGQETALAAVDPVKKVPVDKAKSSETENNVVTTATPKPDELADEVAALKAENAAVMEQLRKMSEQQKAMLEQVDRLQKRLDGPVSSTADSKPPADQIGPPVQTEPATDAPTAPATTAVKQGKEERYREGIILWKTPDEDKVPFLLKLNVVTQFRYLNTLDSPTSYTDHLGVVRDVHRRNDVTVNRTMFTFTGYMFSKKLQYSMLVWTAAGAATIIVAGSIGWQFNKHLTVTGGYLGIPGSRSLTNTFPYFSSTDRTMADNFFRPGFTQGVMASGEIKKNLYYNAFLGNSLNTLSITANKIDTNLMGAASVWWEPLGNYAPPGRSMNMYDDYFAEKRWRIRLGTSFTVSREDRFSALDTSSPENTGVYNSDGVNAFQTGAFGIGVTMRNATYKMWAADWGAKYNGLAINGQYYWRTLSDFDADGPLTLKSTFDHGYEFSVGKFVVPKKVMLYGRASGIFGAFRSPYEVGAGLKWHPLPTEKFWMNAELMRVHRGAAYNGAFSPYTSGMTGWVPMIQSVLAF